MSTEPALRPSASAGPSVSRRRLTIGICTVVVAIAFEVIAVNTAMPAAARDLDGMAYYAWSFSAFVIGMLFSTVVAGRLSDRIGPARPMLIGLGTFTVGLVLAGAAPVMAQLVAGRLVQGLGGGMVNTAMFVLIASVFTPAQRPRMFTFISTAWLMPAFVGPPVSAWLTETLSWHWVFWSVIPLVAAGTAMIWPTLRTLIRTWSPPDTAGARRPAPLWAAGAVALAVAALQLAGQRLDLVAVGLLVAALVGLGVGLPPLMPPHFLRLGRGMPSVVLVRALLPGAFFGTEAFLPLMLVEQRGFSLFAAGLTLTFGAVGWTAGSYLQSRPWVVLRRDRLITVGAGFITAGVAGIAATAVLPGLWVGVVGAGWLLGGLGMGLSMSSTNLAAMAFSDDAQQGRTGSSLNVGDALGSATFIGVAGTLFAALRDSGNPSLTFGTPMAVMAAVAVVATVMSLRVGAVRNEVAKAA